MKFRRKSLSVNPKAFQAVINNITLHFNHKDTSKMATALLAIGFIGIFFIFMAVRLIFIKGGEFKGTCASQSPFLNQEGATCGYCGKKVTPGENCGSESEVAKVMGKF